MDAKIVYRHHLADVCTASINAIVDTYLKTLIRYYLKPYLITKGYNHHKVVWATEILQSAITYCFTATALRAGTDLLLRTTIKPALIKAGIDLSSAEHLAAGIGTVVAFTQNPFSLLKLGLTSGSVAVAQTMAYDLIHELEKLKNEPEEDLSAENQHEQRGQQHHRTSVRRRK